MEAADLVAVYRDSEQFPEQAQFDAIDLQTPPP
jgi:hypothetical protein